MTTQTFPLLTIEFINNNIGKEITWFAPAYKGNIPYKGICKLLGIVDGKLIVEHLKGDDLSLAWAEGDGFTYSDSGRPVKIGNAFDIYRITRNGFNRDIVVPAGNDPVATAKAVTIDDQFELKHIV